MQLTLPILVTLLSALATAVPVEDNSVLKREDGSSGSSGLRSRSATGYQGPGVYTFTNAVTNLRADLYLGNPAPGTSINMW